MEMGVESRITKFFLRLRGLKKPSTRDPTSPVSLRSTWLRSFGSAREASSCLAPSIAQNKIPHKAGLCFGNGDGRNRTAVQRKKIYGSTDVVRFFCLNDVSMKRTKSYKADFLSFETASDQSQFLSRKYFTRLPVSEVKIVDASCRLRVC